MDTHLFVLKQFLYVIVLCAWLFSQDCGENDLQQSQKDHIILNKEVWMAYFFAQRMTHCECVVATESGWEVLNNLGNLSLTFIPQAPLNYQSPFIAAYKSCEESLLKIESIRKFLQRISSKRVLREVKSDSKVLRQFERDIIESKAQGYMYINQIQEEIQAIYRYILQQSHGLDETIEHLKTISMELCLRLTINHHKEKLPEAQSIAVKCICIKRDQNLLIKRCLFRMTKGNSFVHDMELQNILPFIKNTKLAEELHLFFQQKIACFIVFQKGSTINKKIERFVESFSCLQLNNDFNVQKLESLKKNLTQIQQIYSLTVENLDKYVERLYKPKKISQISWLVYLQAYTRKQKQIYRVLSTAIPHKNLLQFKLYVATKELPLNLQLSESSPPFMLQGCPLQNPPTKLDSNIALNIVQKIVNTYGVPSYKQINPSVFYVISFGFFIGVMFGDVGHMLLALPLLIVLKADPWFYSVVFFMGYCGLIYNQFFGLTLGLFSSCYAPSTGLPIEGCVCSFGLDPIWAVSVNGMQFINSIKMKTAVIIAVLHMMLGLFLKLINNYRQKQISHIILTTIPQILFLSCTFLYMDYLIVYKWLSAYPQTNQAPSIISTMIAIFVDMAKEKETDLLFFPNERAIEKVVLAIAFMCVPIMLLGQPLWQYFLRKKVKVEMEKEDIELKDYNELNDFNEGRSDTDMIEIARASSHSTEKEGMGQVFVHQFIETIEYVLGTVSNTASYLRLWALSLAHAQLSEVIFSLILENSLRGGYAQLVKLIIGFPFFLLVTFGVLICMDTLECFLHSLRLHWVEFQNKFYQGKGYLFEPYSFQSKLMRQ